MTIPAKVLGPKKYSSSDDFIAGDKLASCALQQQTAILAEAWRLGRDKRLEVRDADSSLVDAVLPLVDRHRDYAPRVGSEDVGLWTRWFKEVALPLVDAGARPSVPWLIPADRQTSTYSEPSAVHWLRGADAVRLPGGALACLLEAFLEAFGSAPVAAGHDPARFKARCFSACIAVWAWQTGRFGGIPGRLRSLCASPVISTDYERRHFVGRMLAFVAHSGATRRSPAPTWLAAEFWLHPGSIPDRLAVGLLDPALGCPPRVAHRAYLNRLREEGRLLGPFRRRGGRGALALPSRGLGAYAGLRVTAHPRVRWLEEVRIRCLREGASAVGVQLPDESQALAEYEERQARAEERRRRRDREAPGLQDRPLDEPESDVDLSSQAEVAAGRWAGREDRRIDPVVLATEVLGEYMPGGHVVHLYGPMIRVAAGRLLGQEPSLAAAAAERWGSEPDREAVSGRVDPVVAVSEALAWVVLAHELGHAVWYEGVDLRGGQFADPQKASVGLHELLAQQHVETMLSDPALVAVVPWPVREVFDALVPRQPAPYQAFRLLPEDGEEARRHMLDATRGRAPGEHVISLLRACLDEAEQRGAAGELEPLELGRLVDAREALSRDADDLDSQVGRAREALRLLEPELDDRALGEACLWALLAGDPRRYLDGPAFSVDALVACQRHALSDDFVAIRNHPVLDLAALEKAQRRREGQVAGVVLVGVVGHNPASVLLAARAYQPSRLVLVATEETEGIAEVLHRQVGLPGDRGRIVKWPSVPSIDAVARDALEDVAPAGGEQVVVDVTGGPKTLSIGVWQGLSSEVGDRLVGVYLRPDGRLVDAGSGEVIERLCRLRAQDFLDWRGAKIAATKWSGFLDGVPNWIGARGELAQALLKSMHARLDLQIRANRERARLEPERVPNPLPKGFTFADGWLRGPGGGYLSKNGWLEELCLLRAVAGIGTAGNEVEVTLGLQLTTPAGGTDEMDVVLVRGASVVVIEAKARGVGQGAGAGLQKRIQKARSFFGPQATVVFVHPAWNRLPPPGLQQLAGRGVVLTSGRGREIEEAVREGLGL